MIILRGVCQTPSSASPIHRVAVTVPGVCDNQVMDTLNGIFLKKGDEVFVYFEEEYNSPLVLGRCSGQLEIQDLVNVINAMVTIFNTHTHAVAGSVASPPTMKQNRITPDNLLY